MTATDLYADFTCITPTGSQNETALAAARDAGFEDGYRTGWDDAHRKLEEAERTLSAELERNVADLRQQAVEVERLVRQETADELTKLFDRVIRPSLSDLTLAHAEAVARKATDGDGSTVVEFAVAPTTKAALSRVYERRDRPLPGGLIEDSTLAPDQIALRIDRTEHSLIDLQPLLTLLKDQLEARAASFNETDTPTPDDPN